MPITSPAWPYIRSIANLLTIPGTDIGLKFFTEIQDKLSSEEETKKINLALSLLVKDTRRVVETLDQQAAPLSEQSLSAAAKDIAEALYLRELADRFLYIDFKGIEQTERFVPLKLDSVFVNLLLTPESPARPVGEHRIQLAASIAAASEAERTAIEANISERDAEGVRARGDGAKIDAYLKDAESIIVLGGPGSGKTTLLKSLARACALGRDAHQQSYGMMPWCFPIILPVTQYDHAGGGRPLFDYIAATLADAGGDALVARLNEHWWAQRCLVLLDGLDEVADMARRIDAARKVGEFLRRLSGNRAVVSSRRVGYSICRVTEAAEHLSVLPFGRDDIARFSRQWHLAYEHAVHPESPNEEEARQSASTLVEEISANRRIASLAANPLMLTIIALIKRQHVKLPERRVQLYEIALNTLIRSWNLARSLSGRPIGKELGLEETKKVWGEVAYWMHGSKSTGTCHRDELMDHLSNNLRDLGLTEIEATRAAESYLVTAAENAGLLEERGTHVFAFMHQTFQEYLAARHLAKPHCRVLERIEPLTRNPRWREVIRLLAGYIGVVQEDDEMATTVVSAIHQGYCDALDRHLRTNLRLAAECVADDVRVHTSIRDRILLELCDCIATDSHWQLVNHAMHVLESCQNLLTTTVIDEVIRLARHSDADVKIAAADLLSACATTYEPAYLDLKRMVASEDEVTAAFAAIGLWNAGDRSAPVCHVMVRCGYDYGDEIKAPDELVARCDEALQEAEPEAARQIVHTVVGAMSTSAQAAALACLKRLLGATDFDVRCTAADVLIGWGDADATGALVKVMEAGDVNRSCAAACVLADHGVISGDRIGAQYASVTEPEALRRLVWHLQHHRVPAESIILSGIRPSDPLLAAHAAFLLLRSGDPAGRAELLTVLSRSWNRAARFRFYSDFSESEACQSIALELLHSKQARQRQHGLELVLHTRELSEAVRQRVRWLMRNESLPLLRLRSALALAAFEGDDEACDVLFSLAGHDRRAVRVRAASWLAAYGRKWENRIALLREIAPAGADIAAAFFEGVDHARYRGEIDASLASVFADALRERPEDENRTLLLRDVLFAWLWDVLNPSE